MQNVIFRVVGNETGEIRQMLKSTDPLNLKAARAGALKLRKIDGHVTFEVVIRHQNANPLLNFNSYLTFENFRALNRWFKDSGRGE